VNRTKLRILSVNISDLHGGASKAAYRINSALVDRGVKVQMIVKNKLSNDVNVLTLA